MATFNCHELTIKKLKEEIEANRQLRALVRNQEKQIKKLEQKLAAKSWLKRFLNWLDRNFN